MIINPYRFAAASSFDPTDITGLTLWHDASDSSTLFDATSGGSTPADDGEVLRWEDKSGNGHHATNGTTGQRPLRRVAEVNGLDTVDFDGSNDRLLFSTGVEFNDYSCIACFQRPTSGTTSVTYAKYNTDLEWPGVWNNTDNKFYHRRSGFYTSSANTGTGIFILSATRTGTSGNMYLDGASLASGSVSTGTSSINSVGSFSSGGSRYHDGNICEILMYDSVLSAGDRGDVETYLADKWGVTL